MSHVSAIEMLEERCRQRDARIETLEAALRETDQMVGALWADLFNKDMVKPGADWFFDKWRAQMRDIARAALDEDAS